MKLYQELQVKRGSQEVLFGGLILNDKSELEFTVVKTPKGVFGTSAVVNEKAMKIRYNNLWLPVTAEDVKRLGEWKQIMVTSISKLYKDILTGKEEILAYPIKGEEAGFILTTETILNFGIYSPKYTKAMLYAFSKDGLKNIKIDMDLGFDGYDEFLIMMTPIINKMGLKLNSVEGTGGHVQKFHSFKLTDVIQSMSQAKAS